MILFLDNKTWIWVGKGASQREKIGAEEAVEAIGDGHADKPIIVNEGNETEDFWLVTYYNSHLMNIFKKF